MSKFSSANQDRPARLRFTVLHVATAFVILGIIATLAYAGSRTTLSTESSTMRTGRS